MFVFASTCVTSLVVSWISIQSTHRYLRGTINANKNTLDASDPLFDEHYVPQSDGYEGVGYRPVSG